MSQHRRKTFSVIFVFLFLASCGKGSSNSSTSKKALSVVADQNESSVENQDQTPNEAITFDVNVKMSGFSREDEEKVLAAVELIKKVVASNEFKEKVELKKYNGKKTYVDNGGLTNAQIYKKILLGAEKLGNTRKNNTMDLDLKVYRDNKSSTIGYTYPNITRIYLNKKYLDQFKAHDVAGNLFHEWLHKLGFKHAVEKTANRNHSVPYTIGYLVKNMAIKFSN